MINIYRDSVVCAGMVLACAVGYSAGKWHAEMLKRVEAAEVVTEAPGPGPRGMVTTADIAIALKHVYRELERLRRTTDCRRYDRPMVAETDDADRR